MQLRMFVCIERLRLLKVQFIECSTFFSRLSCKDIFGILIGNEIFNRSCRILTVVREHEHLMNPN